MNVAGIAGAADPQRELNESDTEFHDEKRSPPDGSESPPFLPICSTIGLIVYTCCAARYTPSFAEHLHWARLSRQKEDADKTKITGSHAMSGLIHTIKGDKDSKEQDVGTVTEAPVEEEDQLVGLSERDLSLVNARRVLRQAGWASAFYLITCDMKFALS